MNEKSRFLVSPVKQEWPCWACCYVASIHWGEQQPPLPGHTIQSLVFTVSTQPTSLCYLCYFSLLQILLSAIAIVLYTSTHSLWMPHRGLNDQVENGYFSPSCLHKCTSACGSEQILQVKIVPLCHLYISILAFMETDSSAKRTRLGNQTQCERQQAGGHGTCLTCSRWKLQQRERRQCGCPKAPRTLPK